MSFFTKINSKMSVGMAATILSGSYLSSAVLGLLRDRLLAAKFGIGSDALDSYIAAFSIPDLLYFFLVTGALSVTFIPVFVDRMKNSNKQSAWELSSSVINLMALVTFVSSIIIFIFASQLIYLTAPGFGADRHDLATAIMRIIAISPFIFSISTVLGSMQQASSRFFFFAISPVIYNFGIILGILILSPRLGIIGVALGVAIGAFLQLCVHLIGMIGLGFDYTPRIYWKNKGFKQVLKMLLPRSLDQGLDAVNSMVERFIASFFIAGSITTYSYAFNLQSQPIILIGVAIATASFPSISASAANDSKEKFADSIKDVLGSVLWFALPAAVIAFIMRGYLVRLYIGQGNSVVASALGWFSVAIVFRALFHSLTRAFYAQKDTKTPLNVSFIAIGLNIVLAFVFADLFKNSISGLALAQSVVAAVEAFILIYILHKRLGSIVTMKFINAIGRIIMATFAMSVVTYLMVRYVFPLRIDNVGFFTLAPQFVAILAASGVAYVASGVVLKLNQANMFIDVVKAKIFRPLKLSDFK